MEEAKVSVIIPVYNAAEYLERCLDSVVGQSHRNLEILLIDDGSTDGSGEICDRYAKKDGRIRVLHQKNAGVAFARNAGLDMAVGTYIGWVDSDDWIEPEMFEVMVKEAKTRKADIVICGRLESYPDRSFQKGWKRQEVLNREQALALLVEDDLVRSYLCDKLWRRELFDGIRIPALKVFEDMAVMYQLFMRAEQVVCLPDVFYHYEHRDASLTAAPSLESRIDFYRVSKARYDALRRDLPQGADGLEKVLVSAAVPIWAAYYDHPKREREKYREQVLDIAAFCKSHSRAAEEADTLGLAGRLVLRLTPYPRWWAFTLARWISGLYEKRHGRPL